MKRILPPKSIIPTYHEEQATFHTNGGLGRALETAISANAKRFKREVAERATMTKNADNEIAALQQRLHQLKGIKNGLNDSRPMAESTFQKALWDERVGRSSTEMTPASLSSIFDAMKLSSTPLSGANLNTLRQVSSHLRESVRSRYEDITIESPTFQSDFFGYTKKMFDLKPFELIERTMVIGSPFFAKIEVILYKFDDLGIYVQLPCEEDTNNENNEEDSNNENNENNDKHEDNYCTVFQIHLTNNNTPPYSRIEESAKHEKIFSNTNRTTLKGEAPSLISKLSVLNPKVRRAINVPIKLILSDLAKIPPMQAHRTRVLH
jgi:hypothetical protein